MKPERDSLRAASPVERLDAEKDAVAELASEELQNQMADLRLMLNKLKNQILASKFKSGEIPREARRVEGEDRHRESAIQDSQDQKEADRRRQDSQPNQRASDRRKDD